MILFDLTCQGNYEKKYSFIIDAWLEYHKFANIPKLDWVYYNNLQHDSKGYQNITNCVGRHILIKGLEVTQPDYSL